MRVLIPTDSFPPVCGGSGWSTFELARGLRGRGHEVIVVQPRPGSRRGVRETHYDGIRVLEWGAAVLNVPYVRNYFKNERLYASLADYLTGLIAREGVEIVHGQHVLTCLPSIDAAHRSGLPAICTVRDYWPVCYWSDLIHTNVQRAFKPAGDPGADAAGLCPACSGGMMTQCVRPRAGALWPLAVPMIPYMRANLARKRSGLASADAVIAVSSTIASDLRARAPELSESRIEVIPNPVNIADLRARAAAGARPLETPYALYLGKLAPNKGTSHLIRIVQRARLDWPLVVAGDGPERATLQIEAAQSGRDIRFVGWIDQNAAAVWLAHASILVFPSRGPESLSRVLIEASALGVPIAAMNTGGTPDIIIHEHTGLLSATPEALADDLKRLRHDESLRLRLGAAARQHAGSRFDAAAVVTRTQELYEEVLKERRQ